jgi:hypothetical protein
MSDTEYCIRVCKEGPNAPMYCQHVYGKQSVLVPKSFEVDSFVDIQGCHWNMPGNYDAGFDFCKADE